MNDTLTCEAVLLARTVPEETKDGDVTICSAWWAPPLGGLIRVYPLDLRGTVTLHAWECYRLTLTKSTKDKRWRSFKLAEGTRPVFVEKTRREALREPLRNLCAGVTIKQLNVKRDSMAVIEPLTLEGILEDGAPDITHRFGRKTFGIRPRLHFTDHDGEHNLGLNEWGCYEWLRKGNPPEGLWDNLRLSHDDREQLLLVGNLRDHPTSWVVIDVIGYSAIQPSLFVSVAPAKRASVFARDGYACVHCGAKESLSIDHVIPQSRGGTSDEDNLQTLCLECNSKKSDSLAA